MTRSSSSTGLIMLKALRGLRLGVLNCICACCSSAHGLQLCLMQVSNSPVAQVEYEKALAKAQRGHSKFITKGDVQQALERLRHARK